MMKKLLALLFLSGLAHAGTITTTSTGLMTITYSSGTAAASASPLTFVQAVSTATTDGGCGSTLTAITPTAGHLLVLGCATTSNYSGINPSDNVGDVWLKAGDSTGTVTTGNYIGIWYVASAVGGATTVTAATGGCNGVNYCVLDEYSGQAASPFDVFSSSIPTAGTGINPITTLAATTSGTNETMFSFGFQSGGVITTSQTGTSRYLNAGSPGWAAQDANVAAAGVYVSTWTITSPYTWMAAQAAFKHP